MPNEPKRQRGRPTLGATKLNDAISVRLALEEAAAVRLAATRMGCSDSEWVRNAVRRALEAETPPQGDPTCSSTTPSS